MIFDLSKLGPRGWAVTIVIGGCVISAPFLRSCPAPAANGSPAQSISSSVCPAPPPLNSLSERGCENLTGRTPTRASHFQFPPTEKVPAHQVPVPTSASQLPLAAEFPDWARKPSLLDELIESKSNDRNLEMQELPLRKPTPFRTWSNQGEASCTVTRRDVPSVDRDSPFAEDSHLLTTQSHSIAQVVWPDQDLPPSIDRQSRPTTQLVRTPALSTTGQGGASLPGPTISRNELPKNDPIGAALRSTVVPSRELFIQQPGISKSAR